MTHLISDIPAGTVLAGRYTVRDKLGDGAVASVYLATDTTRGTDVALKVLDPFRSADPVGRLRFERELEVLSRISHPGVARCFGLEKDGELDILVLEHVEGETIAARIKRGRLPVAEAAQVALQTAYALEACHRQGVLHRDLKPANIILHPTRGPVILDFGVAWFSSAATLTRTGSVVGSPQYIAPEVFKSPASDARADLYALGVILFEMLTGRPVQLADSLAEMAVAHLETEPPLVSSLRPEVPRALSEVVARALALRAEERFATAGELALAISRGVVVLGRSLEARIPCHACKTSLVISLAICPGCGTEVAWELSDGPYAVELHAVPDPELLVLRLRSKHARSMRTGYSRAVARLRNTPVPLAVGVSRVSADQLLSEAEEVGCRGQVLRASSVIGAKLQASHATPVETLIAVSAHFACVSASLWSLAALGVSATFTAFTPAIFGALGLIVARFYVRRPLLGVAEHRSARSLAPQLEKTRKQLATLKGERARSLAAGAVARAAPVLIDGGEGLSEDARRDVESALESALAAANELDLHAATIAAHPREKRSELTETAIAHDLAARRVLEACQEISTVVALRTKAAELAEGLVKGS